jgi:hypothetical protein
MNNKGQFFSPDLIIAIIIFVFALLVFFMATDLIFINVSDIEKRKLVDDASYSTMHLLVNSSGKPVNWEIKDFDSIELFGLINKNNEINNYKLNKFIYHLQNNYNSSKQLLGLNRYDFQLQLIDSNGDIIIDSTNTSTKNSKVIFDRIVLYNNKTTTLRGVIYYE